MSVEAVYLMVAGVRQVPGNDGSVSMLIMALGERFYTVKYPETNYYEVSDLTSFFYLIL